MKLFYDLWINKRFSHRTVMIALDYFTLILYLLLLLFCIVIMLLARLYFLCIINFSPFFSFSFFFATLYAQRRVLLIYNAEE